jgi:hypothetical protein
MSAGAELFVQLAEGASDEALAVLAGLVDAELMFRAREVARLEAVDLLEIPPLVRLRVIRAMREGMKARDIVEGERDALLGRCHVMTTTIAKFRDCIVACREEADRGLSLSKLSVSTRDNLSRIHTACVAIVGPR